MVTQLGECVTEDHEVAGSSPAHGTMIFPPPQVIVRDSFGA